MKFTPKKLNLFLLTKLPSAYISGVRSTSITENETIVKVKHRWMNQNPFGSLYWATQGMASELATGILVMKEIDACGKRISMLVTHQTGVFTKKARGMITFSCVDGDKIKSAIAATVKTGEGQTITMISSGVDEKGDLVSTFEYVWSVKLKS